MHPSSNVDVADMHTEKMMIKTKKMFYKYDSQLVPITEKDITIKQLENGKVKDKEFKNYFTNHDLIMAKRKGQ